MILDLYAMNRELNPRPNTDLETHPTPDKEPATESLSDTP